jgi:hypothetical protein
MKSSQFHAERRYDFLGRMKPQAMTFRSSSAVKNPSRIGSSTVFTNQFKGFFSLSPLYWYAAKAIELIRIRKRINLSNHLHSTKEMINWRIFPFTGKMKRDRQQTSYSFSRTLILGCLPE